MQRVQKSAWVGMSRRRRWVVLMMAVVGLLVVGPTAAQEGCELALQSASELFAQGRFTAAEGFIAECLEGKPRRAEKVQAYALRAKIYLANDDLMAARHALTLLLAVDSDYEPDLFDSPRYQKLVAEVKATSVSPSVTSVSKSKESLFEAPATVAVITADEIRRRGYLDLEAMLHDLPGFDFSRNYGAPYAEIYQRGYRTADTTRTLLLIDGVEDNDLHSSVAYISRQFPLSMIDRVEVIYGPASTMYGANAFAGVINVITKEPEQLIAEGRKLGYDAWITGGSWSTGSLDATVAGRTETGNMSWSLAARRYESDEFDLSGYDDWDYDPAYYDTIDYQSLGNLNPSGSAMDSVFANYTPEEVDASPYFDVLYDEQGNPLSINLTAAGEQRARELDQAALAQVVNGSPIGFTNRTEDWMVYGKLKTSNLVVGMGLYSRGEGINPPVTDTYTAGSDNGSFWDAEHMFMYAKYVRRYYEDKLLFTFFTRYKKHDVDSNNSGFAVLRSYRRGMFGVNQLLAEVQPFWGQSYTYRSNNQLRSEFSLFYDHSESFNIIGGLELRYSSIGAQSVSSSTPPASETGTVSTTIPGGNEISVRDYGLFAQASYRPVAPLKLVAGFRVDDNKIRDTQGYGTVINPRLAAVYSWQDFVFKLVYSEAFQDVPVFQKFETSDRRQMPNPGLAPEEVKNFELSAAWSPREDLSFQLVAYQSDLDGIVEEVEVECDPAYCEGTTRQFNNRGSLELRGIQAEGKWTPGAFTLAGNYTFSDPYNPDLGVRVGDIADHRINLIGEYLLKQKLEFALRVNGVYGRKTGAGTTVSANPFTEIEDYTVAHFAVTYRDLLPSFPGLDLQLTVNNLFDSEYWDPGYRDSDGALYASRIPQPERSFFLSLRVTR